MTEGTAVIRLLGSVAEISASPEGNEVGAFFDVDGTLVAGFTASIHAKDGMRDMGARQIAGMLKMSVDYQLGRTGFADLVTTGTHGLRGRRADELEEIGERLFQQHIADLMYPEMREVVRAHQQRGHTVVLSSSAMPNQIEPIARYLGIDNVVCNRQVVDDDGLLTGEIVQPIIWGPGKSTAVQEFAAERGIDLSRSYFYADGDEDLPLMYVVGHPRPTNPGPRLGKVARKRGWPVLQFTSRGGSGTTRKVRSAAGLASLVPICAAAVGVGLVSRNRRRGLNLVTTYWPKALLAINGVTLNVTGEENLTVSRPAIFVFNHRNNFDPFMVASLVKSDFTGVAKKELKANFITGTIGRLLDVAFIDRADSARAVAALAPIQDLLNKGISLVVAPEGTRLDTDTVGPFKMGAFHLALATGVPIVPVVIRNAELVAGRNASALNSGRVDVTVLPPVPTTDWTREDLRQRVNEIRQQYLDTLANWPAAAVPVD
jgi:putative phosphoserine phosphatase / 1-acylglycerol-3-phosphate O-acyltransferase